MKPIIRIKGRIPTTSRYIDISMEDKNLVIVGANGSGKTSFLKGIYQSLQHNIFNQNLRNKETLLKHIKEREDLVKRITTHQDKLTHFDVIASAKQQLDLMKVPFEIDYSNPKDFLDDFQSKQAAILFFEAFRQSNISRPQHALAAKLDKAQLATQGVGSTLEQHLVNLKVRTALTPDDTLRVEKTRLWFEKLEKDFRYLFEDESFKLTFDPEELRFKLYQAHKPTYDMQSLSSGYQALFSVLAELIMRSEYLSDTPAEMQGVVIIDEIDVHLHVSLQRKILPFLASSFPKLQFIVSTHSPFVITSVDDMIIYDISTSEACDDLSVYSIETVVEGLLGVPSRSKPLEEILRKLAAITQAEKFSTEEAELLIEQLEPHSYQLDPEASMIYELALNKILKAKNSGE